MPTLSGQSDGQLSGQWMDRAPQSGELVACGVHEVDVLGQRLADRAGQRLGTPVGYETAADLVLDLLAQPVEARLHLVAGQAFFQGGQMAVRGLAPRRLEHAFEESVQIEVPQRSVEVVRAADRASRLHPRVTADCEARERRDPARR